MKNEIDGISPKCDIDEYYMMELRLSIPLSMVSTEELLIIVTSDSSSKLALGIDNLILFVPPNAKLMCFLLLFGSGDLTLCFMVPSS